jgi:hypothetical protein
MRDMFSLDDDFTPAISRFMKLCVVDRFRGHFARRWIPIYLEQIIASTARFQELVRLLGYFHGDTFGDGKAWEAVVVVALYVRLLLSSLKRDLEPSPALPIGLPDWAGFDFHYSRPSSVNLKELLQLVAADVERERVDLLYPTYASFPLYDVIVVVRAPKKARVIIGYQCKDRDAKALGEPAEDVQHSFMLRGEEGVRPSVRKRWTVLSNDERDHFLGPTLAALLPARRPALSAPPPRKQQRTSATTAAARGRPGGGAHRRGVAGGRRAVRGSGRGSRRTAAVRGGEKKSDRAQGSDESESSQSSDESKSSDDS